MVVSCGETRKAKANAAASKPNVILFLVDDLGWTDLGCYGSDLYETPVIDKMAEEGVKFTNAYSACTVCSPTRASIMTGKYPARLHLTDWIAGHQKPYAKMQIPEWTQYLPQSEYTLAEVLKDNGYATAHIGKWHLGEDSFYWPEYQGFDKNIGGWAAGSPKIGSGGKGYFSPYNNPRLKDGPTGEYLNDRLAWEAVDFIKQNNQKPFFLNFWLYNVHTPLQAKIELIEKYKQMVKGNSHHNNPVYAAMVENMDESMKAIMDALKENGLDDNTIVIFASDNGGLRGNHGNQKITDNFPLRSGKGDVYEGGVRVPFIVWWKNKIKPGVNETPVISMDIFNTIVGLTGSRVKNKAAGMDGADLSGLLLNGKPVNREALYWHYPHYHLEGAKPYSAIREGDWKLIAVYEDSSLQLYNLKDDIGENKDLSKTNKTKTAALYNKLRSWRQSVGAQSPALNPSYDPAKEQTWGAKGGGR